MIQGKNLDLPMGWLVGSFFLDKYTTLWYVQNHFFFPLREGFLGPWRVQHFASKAWENAETNGRTPGNISKSNTKFRTGMAKRSGPYRTAGALFDGCQSSNFGDFPSLLGNSWLFLRKSNGLSCLGIPGWQSLLVYQWYHLPGGVPWKMEPKNGNL